MWSVAAIKQDEEVQGVTDESLHGERAEEEIPLERQKGV